MQSPRQEATKWPYYLDYRKSRNSDNFIKKKQPIPSLPLQEISFQVPQGTKTLWNGWRNYSEKSSRNPNSESKLPSKTIQEKRIAFANAFCVYDLDKVLAPIFDKKNKDFRKKQRKGEIDKDETNPYTKEYLKSEISSITGLSEDNIKVYRTLMKEYIGKEKFVDLIKGVSNNK